LNKGVIMGSLINLGKKYSLSPNLVVREIEGEVIIIPLTSGVGDMEEALFTLNPTGLAIWQRLDGKKSVREVIQELDNEYDASREEIEEDVVGLLEELYQRKLIVEEEG